jgi:D-threo-aldose 1-dehydrogenase
MSTGTAYARTELREMADAQRQLTVAHPDSIVNAVAGVVAVDHLAGMTHWRPPVRFGLGGVALGNGFAPLTEAQAHDALHAAWDAGIRYYDTSPFYGFGLSERRFGHFLHTQNRGEYTLSTKVGRIFTAGAPRPHPL